MGVAERAQMGEGKYLTISQGLRKMLVHPCMVISISGCGMQKGHMPGTSSLGPQRSIISLVPGCREGLH